MPVFNNILAGASGATGAAAFQIDRSLRFNSADSAYLSRTPSSAGNRKTWTWSGWVKRCTEGHVDHIFNSTGYSLLYFFSDHKLDFDGGGTGAFSTARAFRDFSAWYHIVLAFDTTQATASDRIKLWVNGEQVEDWDSITYPTQNADGAINSTGEHKIGHWNVQYSNCYLADVHFIDGQALEATDFGEPDDNNNWNPKEYSGTYGTNGFHLDFSDNSSNSALGTDSSSNSNTWTVNNITASVSNPSYDSTHGSNITSAEAAKIFDSDDSTYGVATGDFVGFVYGGSSVKMKVENTKSSQVSFYIQPNVSNSATNSGTWGSQSAGTVSSNQWYIPANTTATAIFTFPTTWDGDGRIYASGNEADLRFYSMDASAGDLAGNDSLIDTPTNYEADSGNNGGNYATLNPLNLHSSSNDTLSNGNLECSMGSGSAGLTPSTIGFSSGKFYYEVVFSGSVEFLAGIRRSDSRNYDNSYTYHANGNKYTNGGSATSYGATYTDGDVIGVAVNMDAGTLTFYKNGASQGQAFSGISGTYTFIQGKYSGTGGSYIVNFGQRPFAYTPPTGYVSLCTQNLADPTISDGSTAMDVSTWTGTTANQSITGLNFSPDLVWIKARGPYALDHTLLDTVRGSTKSLASNTSAAESTVSYFNSFDSDGFTLNGGNQPVNGLNETHVGFAWDAGSSTASNTDGSITSSVRASQTNGCSIVTYTGNNTSGATVGHGLNAAPDFMMIKRRSGSENWLTYNRAIGATKAVFLNLTDAPHTNAAWFNDTDPSSSVFTLGGGNAVNNSNGDTYVAYCFAPVEGFSAFGSYTGNGSATSPPFVFTGFRPRWVLFKNASGSFAWHLYDTARDTFNLCDARLRPDNSAAEDADNQIDILSNGFMPRTSGNGSNQSGSTFIYAAFAEHPFKTARAR